MQFYKINIQSQKAFIARKIALVLDKVAWIDNLEKSQKYSTKVRFSKTTPDPFLQQGQREKTARPAK